jgi:hypothetical protein
LKASEFNKDLKAKKSVIKATLVIIHLELMEKGTLVMKKTLEIPKKCTVKQKAS